MASQSDWYRPRPYPHFDPPVSEADAQSVVTEPEKIESHAFYPFIKRVDRTPEYRSSEGVVKYKPRRICFAAHLDAHIYAYYSEILSDLYEEQIEDEPYSESVVAYRSFKEITGEAQCNIHFARHVFDFIADQCTPQRPLAALAFDVSSFFDNLDHKRLKTEWGKILGTQRLPEDHYNLYTSLTQYAYVKLSRLKEILEYYEKSRKERSRKKKICSAETFRKEIRGEGHVIVNHHDWGIPQGTPISALLSNIYMRPFDRAVYEKVDDLGGFYRRYSDDLITVVPAERASEVKAFVMDKIYDLELTIQERKTDPYRLDHDGSSITCVNEDTGEEEPLQFLGFVYDGTNVRIRPSSLTSFYRRMNGAVKAEANRADQGDPVDADGRLIHRNSLYERFSHLGDRNFITYAYRAADRMDESDQLSGDAIRAQVAGHWESLHDRIEEWEGKIRAGELEQPDQKEDE
jgi:hypothetical protein